MHLKTLHIKNFKSHKDSIIEFGQITSIIGRNDVGKSNVLRALKMLLHHTDWPSSWIRYGEDTASIKLVLQDNTVVERKRTPKSQTITITKNGVVKDFTGKKDAAQYIESAIGIKKITLDETTGPEDLNFVDVHEGPYLIGGRSDTVQRKIAGIVGANKIDDARARLTKEIKKLEGKLETLDNDIFDSEPSWLLCQAVLDKCTKFLENANNLNKHWEHCNAQMQKLENFVNHFNSLTSTIITNNVVERLQNNLSSLKESESQLVTISLQLEKTSFFKNEFDKPTNKVGDTRKLEQLLANLLKLQVAYANIYSSLDRLIQSHATFSIEQVQEQFQSTQLKQFETELQSLSSEKNVILEALGICPVCNNTIK